ncbi:MAG: methyltransferase [Aphanizomenon flos-aquae Clear-A1]|jgi:hypothetical protein|uniref:Methyltransferase n=1 Tax=Dolichospermum flos-aquae CCAP 1403/13F TaxID=315271 RepID=A0A6H2C1C1_DOLFA|nr:methyltransferase [Dolichospermum flos-aquae]MBD1218246.1 methyltransferase [Aphanizomenon flos-aquae Clear-A1]QJB45233.1 methyltransferase [Dolichospermum flos-aquae CCAP 1403/13F]
MMTTDIRPDDFFKLTCASWISQALGIAAKLSIADLLAEGAKSVEELAQATESHAPSLYRILRCLSTVGVFHEVEPRHFALTPLAEYLQSDNPYSLKYLAITNIDEWRWRVFGDMYHTVKTGEPAIKSVYSVNNYWQYLEKNTEPNLIFSQSMFGIAQNCQIQLLKSYDFSKVGKVVDIAGGQGLIISAILKHNPHLQGLLFDMPETVFDAVKFLKAEGVDERCEVVGGDMFKSIPSGGDIYLMSFIMIDWDDDSIVKFLENINYAMPKNGKLLVIDPVIPVDNQYHWSKWEDLYPMCMGHGLVRTQAEFKAIFRKSGFELVNIFSPEKPLSLMELVRV